MTLIDDLITDLSEYIILGNSLLDYLIAGGIVVILVLVLYFLKFIILRRARSILKKSEKLERINVIISGIDKTLNLFMILIFSLYFGIQYLTIDPNLALLVKALLLVNVTYFFLKFSFVIVDYLIAFQSKRIESSSNNILEFLRLLLKMTFVVIFSLWFLASLGIDTTVFVASLGVFAIAIAFALQNVIADIFAALTIYLDKPFEIGDTIIVGGEMGTVERIGIRSTRLRTLQGHMLIVSNRELISSRISNYQRMERRRVPIVLGVHYNTPTSILKEIPEMIKEVVSPIETVTFDRMFMTNLAGSAIEFELVIFVESKSYTTFLKMQEEVLLKIIDKFEHEGIVIPYPTQTILLKNTSHVEEMN